MKKIEKLYKDIQKVIEDDSREKPKYTKFLNISKKALKVLEDIDENHNHSFALEIIKNNKDNLNQVAINYRGNKITYEDVFDKVISYAKSLKALGYQEGDEIPVCVTNIPEFIYLFLAINLIGCKINSIGYWFDEDYLKFILEKSKSKYLFISDEVYFKIAEKIKDSSISDLVVFSLCDSLMIDKNGIKVNPYKKIDEKHHVFGDLVHHIKGERIKNIIDRKTFESIGMNYEGEMVSGVNLDDDATITYTSGTTSPGVPKAVLHANRSYVTTSRFKDKDISGLASMEGATVLHHIPTYTHMELCSLCDSLYQGCTLALEPFYQKEFFKYSIVMYRPDYSPGGVEFYMDLCRNLNENPEFKNIKLENFIAPVITGEKMSAGEEKYFNYTARKHKFGVAKLPYPIAPVSFSIGGGTTENGAIFTTLFKGHLDKLPQNRNGVGLTVLPFADVEVLNSEGKYARVNESGNIVVNSPCNMKRYYYTADDYPGLIVSNTEVVDAYGNTWQTMNTAGYKSDNRNRIKMQGRNILEIDGKYYWSTQLEDVILKDTKNILTCEIVPVFDEDLGNINIIHVEFSPNRISNKWDIVYGIINRLSKYIGAENLNNFYIRVRSNRESFPVAPSGKKDYGSLKQEGYTARCMSVANILKTMQERKKNNRRLILKMQD